MGRHGVRFQAALRGTLHLSRTNAFFLGGGKALMNAYYAAAARLGVDVFYDTEVVGFEVEDREVRIDDPRGRRTPGRARRGRGHRVGRVRVEPRVAARGVGRRGGSLHRAGTPYNTGGPLKLLLAAGAEAVGDPRACHAIAVDARAPRFDGGIVTRLDCIPLGIVVNRHGDRFADEGEDFWPKRYASWGALIAAQPGQDAWCLVDAKMAGRFMPSVFPPIVAGSVGELATRLGLPSERLEATVRRVQRRARAGTVRSRDARRLPHRGTSRPPRAIGRCRSTRRPSRATRSAPESRSPILASRWTTGRGSCCAAVRPATSSRRGR